MTEAPKEKKKTEIKCLEDKQNEAINLLKHLKGVLAAKVLTEAEKIQFLELEKRNEDKKYFEMCKTLNKAVRIAMERNVTVAMVIQTSEFKYPPSPYMQMIYKDQIVGEFVYDKDKKIQLQTSKENVFLGENFVVYLNKLPKDASTREDMRMVHIPKQFVELEKLNGIKHAVFGEPCTEGDHLIKKLLSIETADKTAGTCVIGFNVAQQNHKQLSAI